MKEHLPLIRRAKIFNGLTDSEISSALICLNATVKVYKKGSVIFSEGDRASFIGIILSGEIQTQKTDYSGNVSIISSLFPSNLISAVASYSTDGLLPFDVVASCDTTLICLNREKLIRPCCRVCAFHTRLIENMLGVIADKNLQLSLKIDILTKRTVREKILSYLYSQSKRAGSNSFSVNLSRRQMAEYLSINRSALSRELSRMQSENLIEFNDNHFRLK